MKWKNAPKQLEAVQLIFGGFFEDSEDKIVPWFETDPDNNINCFTWNPNLSE